MCESEGLHILLWSSLWVLALTTCKKRFETKKMKKRESSLKRTGEWWGKTKQGWERFTLSSSAGKWHGGCKVNCVNGFPEQKQPLISEQTHSVATHPLLKTAQGLSASFTFLALSTLGVYERAEALGSICRWGVYLVRTVQCPERVHEQHTCSSSGNGQYNS